MALVRPVLIVRAGCSGTCRDQLRQGARYRFGRWVAAVHIAGAGHSWHTLGAIRRGTVLGDKMAHRRDVGWKELLGGALFAL